MALQEACQGNSLKRYIAEVCSVWGDGKDLQLQRGLSFFELRRKSGRALSLQLGTGNRGVRLTISRGDDGR